jgi:imidazolonepropionase
MSNDNLVLYENIRQCLTLAGAAKKDGKRPKAEDLGVIENASMVVDAESNTIAWVGTSASLPQEYKKLVNTFSCDGEVWLPEFVECHTHLIHAGERHKDFARRAEGKTYQEIAAEGGGILTTIKHTREAGLAELIESGQNDLTRFQKYGIGTIEMKSGYGLSLESELKILEAIFALQELTDFNIVPTFMPAHATPPEFKGRTEDYVKAICEEWIPEVSKRDWAKYFDVFVEEGFFTTAQAEKMCQRALEAGMKIKLHTDQFNDIGGTNLGLALNAQSLDHLERISDENIRKFGEASTVAVLCPGASLYTGYAYPPARKLIDAGARVALSTDFNPGTCPSRNLPLMTTIACSQMKMTVPEAIVAITWNAAAALGLEEEIGSLEPGKQFRVCPLKTTSYESLPYCFGELE